MTASRMKRHARLQGDAGRLLWVGDDADWNLMRAEPRPQLLCPQQGCGDALHAVRNDRGTRFLRRARDGGGRSGRGCDHWWVTGGAGGPESARHLWLKARLAAICLHLGWAAVPEDPVTYADVWVPDARLALEVQLRRTDTAGRTRARLAAGAAGVIWFIAEDVAARKTLFGAPAVRFLVVAADGRGGPAQPWCDPGEAARLVVCGTVWRWEGWRLGTAPMSGYRFLSEVLGGQRGWCPPGTPGMPHGRAGWVRWTDLALAMGRPEMPVGQLAEEVPLAAAHYLDHNGGSGAPPGVGPRRGVDMAAGVPPDSGLLEPKHDPETAAEAAPQEQERRDRAWLEDRPPHYEDR